MHFDFYVNAVYEVLLAELLPATPVFQTLPLQVALVHIGWVKVADVRFYRGYSGDHDIWRPGKEPPPVAVY